MDEDKSYEKLKTVPDHIRYEFTNQDSIALRKNGVYYKAVGNSAIMLKILGAKTKIRSNFNTFYEQEVLEMSLHGSKFDEIKNYLQTLSLKTLRDDNLFYIIRLKSPINAKRIKRARASGDLRTEVTEDILLKRRHSTPLSKEVREIFKEVGLLVSAMKSQDGQVLGLALLNEVIDLQRAVRVLTRTETPSGKLKLAVDDAADDLLGTLLLVPNFVEQATRLARIGRSVNTIRLALVKIK